MKTSIKKMQYGFNLFFQILCLEKKRIVIDFFSRTGFLTKFVILGVH